MKIKFAVQLVTHSIIAKKNISNIHRSSSIVRKMLKTVTGIDSIEWNWSIHRQNMDNSQLVRLYQNTNL